MKETALSRLIRYVKIDTQSSEESQTYPSTSKQFDLLNLLVRELTSLGLKDVEIDQHGYVIVAGTGAASPASSAAARLNRAHARRGAAIAMADGRHGHRCVPARFPAGPRATPLPTGLCVQVQHVVEQALESSLVGRPHALHPRRPPPAPNPDPPPRTGNRA